MLPWLKNIAAGVPAIALVLSAMHANLLYGPGSPWLGVISVAGYFDRAISILPMIVFGITIGVIFGPMLRPLRLKGETDNQYAERTGWTKSWERRVELMEGARAFSWLLFIPFAPPVVIPWAFLIIIMANLTTIINFLDEGFGRRLKPAIFDNPMVFVSLLVLIYSITVVWWSVAETKEDMRHFDREGNCESEICMNEALVVDITSRGIFTYSDGVLSFLNVDGQLVLSGPYHPGSSRPMICNIPRICEMVLGLIPSRADPSGIREPDSHASG